MRAVIIIAGSGACAGRRPQKPADRPLDPCQGWFQAPRIVEFPPVISRAEAVQAVQAMVNQLNVPPDEAAEGFDGAVKYQARACKQSAWPHRWLP
jgi:hypothetical protein